MKERYLERKDWIRFAEKILKEILWKNTEREREICRKQTEIERFGEKTLKERLGEKDRKIKILREKIWKRYLERKGLKRKNGKKDL